MIKDKKLVAILIALILIIVAILGYIIYTEVIEPSNSNEKVVKEDSSDIKNLNNNDGDKNESVDTNDWVTYIDPKFRFKIDHPKTWNIKRDTGDMYDNTIISSSEGNTKININYQDDQFGVQCLFPGDDKVDALDIINFTDSYEEVEVGKEIWRLATSQSELVEADTKFIQSLCFPGEYYSTVRNGASISVQSDIQTKETDNSATVKAILETLDLDYGETYSNSKYNYSVSYPSDWTVDDSNANCEDVEEDCHRKAELSISKDGYEFHMVKYLRGRGGIICVFDDSAGDSELKAAGATYLELGQAKELGGGDYRRNKSYNRTDGEEGNFYVCELDKKQSESLDKDLREWHVEFYGEDKEFDMNTDVYQGYTTEFSNEVFYVTPENPSAEYLEILDKIFYSLEE